jgi:hypothetical protein
MVITSEPANGKPWDSYGEFWIKSGKEIIATYQQSFLQEDSYYFHPEAKYKEVLKGAVVTSPYDAMLFTAKRLKAIYAGDVNDNGDFVIYWSPDDSGWYVAQKNLQLIAFQSHMAESSGRRYVNHGIYYMHATKFLKRETARKIAKLCGGKALKYSDIKSQLELNLQLNDTIRCNLRYLSNNWYKDQTFHYDQVKSNFESLLRLGVSESDVRHDWYELNRVYESWNAEPTVSPI